MHAQHVLVSGSQICLEHGTECLTSQVCDCTAPPCSVSPSLLVHKLEGDIFAQTSEARNKLRGTVKKLMEEARASQAAGTPLSTHPCIYALKGLLAVCHHKMTGVLTCPRQCS